MKTKFNSPFRIAPVLIIAGTISFVSFCIYHSDKRNHRASPIASTINQHFSVHEEIPIVTSESEIVVKSIPVINVSAEKKQPVRKTHQDKLLSPIEGLALKATSVAINPSEGGYIESSSGSVVQIPPNAFVYENGKQVSEKVDIHFTEYNNFKEIFLSGIPMVYKINGSEHQFESAGMMKLEASTDNKAVYMNPGSKIKIMLESAEKSKDYNLYYFDKTTSNWIEKGKDQVTYKKKNIKREKEQRKYQQYKPKKRTVHLSSFEGEPDDKVFLWWRSPAKNFYFSFINLTKSYPELKMLATTKWEYKGNDVKEVYARMFNVPSRDKSMTLRRGEWDSYDLELDKENVSATFVFKNEKESLTISIRPKDRNENNLMKVRHRMNLYEKALDKRLQEDNNKYEAYRKDSIAYMNETSQQSLNETRLAVMRSFEIDNLGIWNVDKIADNKSFVAFSLDFVDENNEPIDVDVIYLADKSFNSVFRYNVAKNKVLLNPYSNNMLWAVLPGNKLAVAGQQQLWKLAGTKGRQKITMKVSDDAVASIEEARAALNF